MIQTGVRNSSSSCPPSILRRILMITPILLAAKCQGPSTSFNYVYSQKERTKEEHREKLFERSNPSNHSESEEITIVLAAPLAFRCIQKSYPDWGRTHKQKQETTGNNHQNWRNWEIAIDFPCKLWQVITAKTHKNTTVDSDCVIFHWMPGHRADQRESENRKRSKETSPSPGWVTCNTRRASNLRQWSVDPLGCRNFGPPAALAAVIQDEIVWDHNLVGGFNPSEKH